MSRSRPCSFYTRFGLCGPSSRRSSRCIPWRERLRNVPWRMQSTSGRGCRSRCRLYTVCTALALCLGDTYLPCTRHKRLRRCRRRCRSGRHGIGIGLAPCCTAQGGTGCIRMPSQTSMSQGCTACTGTCHLAGHNNPSRSLYTRSFRWWTGIARGRTRCRRSLQSARIGPVGTCCTIPMTWR